MSFISGGQELGTRVEVKETKKAVAEIIDLSKKKVLRMGTDDDGYTPFVTTASLNISSLSRDATTEENFKFVEREVNIKRKKHGLPMNFDFVNQSPYKTETAPGGRGQVDTWDCGIKAKYTQKNRDGDTRNVNVAVSVTRYRMDDGKSWYQLERNIERIY